MSSSVRCASRAHACQAASVAASAASATSSSAASSRSQTLPGVSARGAPGPGGAAACTRAARHKARHKARHNARPEGWRQRRERNAAAQQRCMRATHRLRAGTPTKQLCTAAQAARPARRGAFRAHCGSARPCNVCSPPHCAVCSRGCFAAAAAPTAPAGERRPEGTRGRECE
jgi:hypothetical protein